MHGRWEFNPRIHDLLQQFSLHFAEVSSLSVTKKQKFYGYTHNRFQHTALNLEYFAF